MPNIRILVVDDDDGVLQLCDRALRALDGAEVELETSSSRALDRLALENFDLLITDLRMPEVTGTELLQRARQIDPGLAALIITGYPSFEAAVETMKLGAMDYLSKPFLPEHLVSSVQSLLEKKRLRETNKWLRRQVERPYHCGDLLGHSAAMEKVRDRIQRTAKTDFDVLIVGETGTGKELVARAIHSQSRRKEGPFAPVNCGAIPEGLLESEFFGHERGAFTGAQGRSIGLFEFANQGTFFLDELNQLPFQLQGKLLRVVQERRIRRVGGKNEIDINVRLIAASSMSLEDAVKRGQFRPDLYHRLDVARIALPALRERTEDIPVLVQTFIEMFGRELETKPTQISLEAMEVLMNHSWPGNVRELQNVIKRALAWARQDVITVEDLPEEIVAQADCAKTDADTGFFQKREQRMATFEKEYFLDLLRRCRGDATSAAREAQVPRGTLYRLLKKHELNPNDFRPGSSTPESQGQPANVDHGSGKVATLW